MTLKIRSGLLAIGMLALSISGVAPASAVGCGSYGGGAGTIGDPYLIGTAADLQAIETDGCFDAYFEQTADLSLAGLIWTSIGTSADFTGTYDGANFTISDLTVSYSDAEDVGLFGTLSGATIMNLRIVDATVTSTGTGTAGVVAGSTRSASTIEKVAVVNGSVTAVRQAGGITGMTWNSRSFITDISVDAAVVSSDGSGGGNNGGGIVGQIESNSATITNASFTGTVDADGNYSGGIVGYGINAVITNAYSVGTVTGDVPHRGGVLADFSGTVQNSYFLGTGVVQVSSDWATSKNASELRTISTYTTIVSPRSPAPWSITDDLAAVIAGTATEDWLIHPAMNSGYPVLVWELDAGYYNPRIFAGSDFFVAQANQVVSATSASASYAGVTSNYLDWVLTDDAGGRAGAVWAKSRLDLTEDFEINAEINLGSNTVNGADGLAFVLQGSAATSLTTGGGLGFGAIVPALAVEFDTYPNGAPTDHSDPTFDYWGIYNNPSVSGGSASLDQAIVPDGEHVNLFSLGELEDGNWRAVQFTWDASSEIFAARVDKNYDGDFLDTGEVLVASSLALAGASSTFGDNPVYWGFTASTGGSTNEQRVRFKEGAEFVGVSRVNGSPVIEDESAKTFGASGGAQTVDFTISDDQTTQAQWSVSAVSSDTGKATVAAAITSGTNARVTITPVAVGRTTVTVTVTDADGASASDTIVVDIASEPDAPTGVSAVAGINQAALSWTAPADTAGTPVTGYKIESSIDAGANWTTETASTGSAAASATVTGLTAGAEYVFRVSAINLIGTSATASSSAVLIPVPISGPKPYSGPSNLSISKNPSSNGKGEVTGENLDSIDAIFIGGVETTFEISENGVLTYVIPELETGNYKIKFYISANQVYLFDYIDIVSNYSSASNGSKKVNAGSFKGYVALYALGHEGKRLSAKVGNDWVIVPEIPAATNDLFRFVEFTGAGYKIRVRIYIDRELLRTVDLTTR